MKVEICIFTRYRAIIHNEIGFPAQNPMEKKNKIHRHWLLFYQGWLIPTQSFSMNMITTWLYPQRTVPKIHIEPIQEIPALDGNLESVNFDEFIEKIKNYPIPNNVLICFDTS